MNVHATALEQVAIFPLTGVFLFPGLILPLHMFEPRYVQMTEWVLERDQLICMATPDREGVPGALGNPPVRPIGGLGRIRTFERLPDGRFNLELVGIGRVRLLEEHAGDTLFRRTRAVPLPSVTGPDDDEAARTTRALLRSLLALGDEHVARIARLADEGIDAARLSDILPGVLLREPGALCAALEDLGVASRLSLCSEALQERLLAHTVGEQPH